MPNNLKQIIDLINKTGDNCVILDQEGNPSHVLVKFSDYSQLAGGASSIGSLSESEILDRVNQEMAEWKTAHQAKKLDNWVSLEDTLEDIKQSQNLPGDQNNSLNQAKNGQAGKTDEKYYFEPVS